MALFRGPSFVSLVGTIPLMVDGTVQMFTSYRSTNEKRLLTGILYGFGMMSAFIRLIGIIHAWLRSDR